MENAEIIIRLEEIRDKWLDRYWFIRSLYGDDTEISQLISLFNSDLIKLGKEITGKNE